VSLLKREARSWAPEPIAAPFPGTSPFSGWTGDAKSDSALRSSAVWACVRLLSDSVSMMPISAYTMRNGIREPIPNPPLIVAPAASTTMTDWVYEVMVSALLAGNAYGRIVRRDSLGYPAQIELAAPDGVRVNRDRDGNPQYIFNGVPVPTEDVWHFKAYRYPGATKGLSPIQYAAKTIATDQAVAEFALGFFRDGAHPSAVLATDQPVNQDQSRTIKDRFVAAVRGREPVVLGNGVKYQQIQISPEESQFLETQKYGVAEICRIFGVPPEMVAAEAGNSLTYANVEQRGMDFLTYSVQPWLTKLESALFPLLPGQKHLRFDTSVLIRTDFETTMKATAIGIASKQMTDDEARAYRDAPPLTDEQRAELALQPFDVSLTGLPKTLPAAPAAVDAPVAETAPAPAPAEPRSAPQPPQPPVEVHNHNIDQRALSDAMASAMQPAVRVMSDMVEAMNPVITVNVPEQPAPVVNVTVEPAEVVVNVPELGAPDVVVNVPPMIAPDVNVTVEPAPVTVEVPARRTTTTVKRDGRGLITETTATESDA